MYEKNLFCQIFSRAYHSLWVRKSILSPLLFSGLKSGTLFAKCHSGCLEKQTYFSWETELMSSMITSSQSFLCLFWWPEPAVRLNSKFLKTPERKDHFCGYWGKEWWGGGIPGGERADPTVYLPRTQEFTIWGKEHALDIHILGGK